MEKVNSYSPFNISNPIDDYIKPLYIAPLTMHKPKRQTNVAAFTAIAILASGIIYLYLKEK